MHKYVPPAFLTSAFNCPRCAAYAQFNWSGTTAKYSVGGFGESGIYISLCSHCQGPAYWYVEARDINGTPTKGRMVVPNSSSAPGPHPEMPNSVRVDYDEARSIINRSPRAAAALLRLAVQKLCEELGETSGNINTDIGRLVEKGLPVGIQQALDVVRVVGNNSVHPGELSSDDIAEVSVSLFELVNIIVEDRIARPKALEALYARLPQGARDAVLKRDK